MVGAWKLDVIRRNEILIAVYAMTIMILNIVIIQNTLCSSR